MKFFFADSQDMVDSTFDFESETRADWRIRQRDDHYPHEVFRSPPYDGVLVSKSVVDGNESTGSRYSLAQRQRFWRSGVHAFCRSDAIVTKLETMGDCGAFSYVREDIPPVTTDDVIEFYERCSFNFGISVDHVILGYQPDEKLPGFDDIPIEWRRRQEITLDLASEFLNRCHARNVHFSPLGVAQGWSPASYAFAVGQLQAMGYHNIALGGMVPLSNYLKMARRHCRRNHRSAHAMDWHSRKVLAWRVSITMDTDFCVEALEESLGRHGAPEIFNTDQGSQCAPRHAA